MASLTWSEPIGRRDTTQRAVRIAASPAAYPEDRPLVILNLMTSRDTQHHLASIGQANLTPDRARALAHDLEMAADVAEDGDRQRLRAALRGLSGHDDEPGRLAAELLAVLG